MSNRLWPALLLMSAAAGCGGRSAVVETPAGPAAGTVALIHGYARTPRSLGAIGDALLDAGYRVCNIGYASRGRELTQIVAHLAEDLASCAGEDGTLDVVTHSFGGILARTYDHGKGSPRLRRVVMLAPPNHGSELGDVVASSGLFRTVIGPIAAQLGTGPTSLPNRLGPPEFEVGVIAGDKSRHPVGTLIHDGPNDGTVTVASARLAGARDFAVAHRVHSFIMNAPEVIAEVRAFIEGGCFSGGESRLSYDRAVPCAATRSP